MKVVMVAPHFHPRTGGVENYTLNIAAQLVTLSWQVVVVTTGSRGAEEHTTVAGMKVYRLPAALTVSNTPVGIHWRRRLRQIFRSERPDVINAHTPVPYLADVAQRASDSIPFVLTYHNDLHKDALVEKALLRVLHQTMLDHTLRRSTTIIATSDVYVRGSRYLRKYQSKIEIVPPGVDLTRFNPDVIVGDRLAAAYGGGRVVLFVGSLNRSQRHKGLDLLISAFARIHADSPDVSLVVVGHGDGMDIYKAMASAAGVATDVHFAGHVADDELPQYYKLATVFAMPSTDRSEGFGMVYAEAGAVGTPVVGARVGGVPSSVRHGETGLLVTPKSVDELYEALRNLLDDEGLARRLGAAGAARAKAELDWRPLGERTSKIFKDLVASA
ncbi:MAG: glycosyltransferase family 4 protein [Acidimicrobiales bacterium]